jgi:hypothetical protein
MPQLSPDDAHSSQEEMVCPKIATLALSASLGGRKDYEREITRPSHHHCESTAMAFAIRLRYAMGDAVWRRILHAVQESQRTKPKVREGLN